MTNVCLVIIVAALSAMGAWCVNVRVTDLVVPPAVVLGESVGLRCTYDLDSEDLYVVKWYKDDLEFYRYEPKDDNQSVVFPRRGIDVDLSKSDSNVVFLRTVELDSAGRYKCQVSTDAPKYSCVQAVKDMKVIILPLEGPQITGGRQSYDFGDNITLRCQSAESKPAAELRWIINDIPIPDDQTDDHGVRGGRDNLEVTSKSLNLQVREEIFRKGRLDISCEASFYGRVAIVSKQITILEINDSHLQSPSIMLLCITSISQFVLLIRFMKAFPS